MKGRPAILFLMFTGIMLSTRAQINFAEYLNQSTTPFIDAREYVDIKFPWTMSGKLQVLLNEGINSLKENHPQQAILNFDEALSLDSTLWMARYYRGISYKVLSRLPEAERNLTATIQAKPSLSEAHLELGLVYLLQKRSAEAEDELRVSTKGSPPLVEGYYFLGVLSLMRSEPEKGTRFFEKCTVINPKFAPAYLMLGILKIKSSVKEDQLTLFNKAISADSSHAQSWFWRGLIYIRLNQREKALSDWSRMLVLRPNDPFFLTMRGELLILMENYDKAFFDLRKALLATEVSENQLRGTLGFKMDLQATARYLIRTGYGLDERAFHCLKKSFCLLLAGRRKDALTSSREAERIQVSAPVYMMEALVYDQSRKYDSSIVYYSKALELDHDIFEAYRKRGDYRGRMKDWTGAFADLNEMIRIQPESNLVYLLRGLLKIHRTDYYGALLDITRYLKTDSLNADALADRALTREKIDDLKGANDDLQKAARLAPTEKLYQDMFRNFMTLKDTVNAVKMYQRVSDYNINVFMHLDAATLFISWKKWEEAKIEIAKVEAGLKPLQHLNDKYFAALFILQGKIDVHEAAYENALKKFKKALDMDPSKIEAVYLRAKVYVMTGQNKKAITDFRKLKMQGYADSEALYQELSSKVE